VNDVEQQDSPRAVSRVVRPLPGRAGLAVLVLLVTGALLSASALVFRWQTGLPGDAVLRADGEVVTTAQYDARLDVLSALYGLAPPESGKRRDAFRRDTAKSMAMRIVIRNAVKAEGLTVKSAQVQTQLDALIQEGYGGDREAFVSSLGENGSSEKDVIAEIQDQLRGLFLYQRVTRSAKKPTAAQAKAYYDDNKAEMVTPERRTVNNIVVRTETEAKDVLARARKGESFANLVKKYSIDESTRDKGGSLGDRAEAELEPVYAKAAFAVKKGEFFGPVKSTSGWNVGQVAKVTGEVPVAYDDIAEQIADKMRSDAQLKLWTAYMKKRISSADIEYADEYRPADPDMVPAGVAPTNPTEN
jgi:peptidyl-prolyl cis-trans isomerase C